MSPGKAALLGFLGGVAFTVAALAVAATMAEREEREAKLTPPAPTPSPAAEDAGS